MKTYICKNCDYILNADYIEDNYKCPKCGFGKENLTIVEEKLAENEIDAIIDSIIEIENVKNNEKIINTNENSNYVEISEKNKSIQRLKDKCIKCGQCKKVCESIANISYNLNECNEPICIGCGSCILNCPTKAIIEKKDYENVKKIIDSNDKIVIAIISPTVIAELAKNKNEKYEIIEKKLIECLKIIGFDYVFNSSFGADINILEEVAEFIDRIKTNKKMPMLTGNCPSWIKYMQIYHPELINNIVSCMNPIEIHSRVLKKYFSEKKGFDESKIVTVSINTCTAIKNNIRENESFIDYSITVNELNEMLEDFDIKIDAQIGKEYDNIVGEFSGSGLIFDISGGQCESFIRTLYRIMTKKDLDIKLIEFKELRGLKGIKEANVIIKKMEIKVAVVQGMENLEKLLKSDKFNRYHFIEVMNCVNGCVGGGGNIYSSINDQENLIKDYSEIIYSIDRKNVNRFSHNNKELKKMYKEYLQNPNSDKCKQLFSIKYENKSYKLKNK